MRAPGWLPLAVSAALMVQLTVAAGALAGPWAIAERMPSDGAGASAFRSAGESDRSEPYRQSQPDQPPGPLTLSAPRLWSGSVPVVGLGVDDAGALEVPASAGSIGFWRDGPRPGQPGAAVVVGHVDLDGRPGVFSRLAAASVGTLIEARVGGEVVQFRVTRVDRYRKTRFPSQDVYRPTMQTELRLITCGGRFDRRTGHYDENVVVRAVRV